MKCTFFLASLLCIGFLLPAQAQDIKNWQMYGKLDMAYLSTNAGAPILSFNYISPRHLIFQSFFSEYSFLDKNGRDREVKNLPTHDVREYGICLGKNWEKEKYRIGTLIGLARVHHEGIYNLQKEYSPPQFSSFIGNNYGFYYYNYEGKVSNSIGFILKSELNFSLSKSCAVGTGLLMNLNSSRSYTGIYASVLVGKLRP